jgi:uncharacterized membrane protein (DUF2068 family)
VVEGVRSEDVQCGPDALGPIAVVAPPIRQKEPAILIWIGVFKLFKCVMLLIVATVTLRLAHGNMLDLLSRWATLLRVDPDNRFVHHVVAALFRTDPRKLDYLAVGTLLYAAIFGTEGIGLLLRKRWAEYFTIVSTSLLIPLEVYELVHRATAVKVVVLALNLVIIAYLIYRVRRSAQPAA